MSSAQRISIDIWSDYVCPFCYLELPLVDRLAREYDGEVDIIWHAFELRPEPAPTLDPNGKYLQDIWARSVYPLAQERGMRLRQPPVQPRSRKAFEAALHAGSVGRFAAVHAGLFRAFFEYGKDIGDIPTLLEVAAAADIEAGPLQNALDNARYTSHVLNDQRLAMELGIPGVPFLLVRLYDEPLRDAVPLRGAVTYERLSATVEQFRRSKADGPAGPWHSV
jgi:predicted DsbA family dithiol-disulfide isomerase